MTENQEIKKILDEFGVNQLNKEQMLKLTRKHHDLRDHLLEYLKLNRQYYLEQINSPFWRSSFIWGHMSRFMVLTNKESYLNECPPQEKWEVIPEPIKQLMTNRQKGISGIDN